MRSVGSLRDLGGVLEFFCRFRSARRDAVCIDESVFVFVRLSGSVGVLAGRLDMTGMEVALPVCIVSEAQRTPELRPIGSLTAAVFSAKYPWREKFAAIEPTIC